MTLQPRTIQLRTQGALMLYRAFDWEVVPLYPNSKKPLLEWSEPTDPAEVDKLFEEYPDANTAVVLGERSKGLACQDFEIEADYLEYYGAGRHHLEDTTLIHTTPNGGVHVLAYSNNSFTKKVKVCEDHPLDVLGEGCIAVMPPSVIDGKRYKVISTWRVNLESDDNLLKSTMERCSELDWTITKRAKPMSVRYIIRGVPEGMRNESAFAYTRFLLFVRRFDHYTVEFELKRWNRDNKPPLPERELMAILESATKYSPLGYNPLACHICQTKTECEADLNEHYRLAHPELGVL